MAPWAPGFTLTTDFRGPPRRLSRSMLTSLPIMRFRPHAAYGPGGPDPSRSRRPARRKELISDLCVVPNQVCTPGRTMSGSALALLGGAPGRCQIDRSCAAAYSAGLSPAQEYHFHQAPVLKGSAPVDPAANIDPPHEASTPTPPIKRGRLVPQPEAATMVASRQDPDPRSRGPAHYSSRVRLKHACDRSRAKQPAGPCRRAEPQKTGPRLRKASRDIIGFAYNIMGDRVVALGLPASCAIAFWRCRAPHSHPRVPGSDSPGSGYLRPGPSGAVGRRPSGRFLQICLGWLLLICCCAWVAAEMIRSQPAGRHHLIA